MAQSNGIEVPLLRKHWDKYDQKYLLIYFFQNFHETDCSFEVHDTKDTQSPRVLESFQWILSDISPVLKNMFSMKEHQDNNCKRIPISDPNFGTILAYAHTKALRDQSFEQLISLYESACEYKIDPLKEKIIGMLRVNLNEAKWINFFQLAYSKRETDLQLFYIFDQMMQKMPTKNVEEPIEKNMPKILSFNADLFYEFISLLKSKKVHPDLQFKIVKCYLIKIGIKKDSSTDGNIIVDMFNSLLGYIDLTKKDLQDFENGSEDSALLDDSAKEMVLGNTHHDKN